MSALADRLDDVRFLEKRVRYLRDQAFQEEVDAHKHRAEADAIELEIVEQRTAANILRDSGLTVGRDASGVPWVKVERAALASEPQDR